MSKAELPQTAGLFGLGLIGQAVAGRLISAGVAVTGHDPDAAVMERLEAAGGRAVAPEEVWKADVVISAVFSTDQLAGLIESAPQVNAGRLISLSTCDPDQMPGFAGAAAARGWELVESPVSGTSADLAAGNAILLVGGDGNTAAELAPLFGALARAHHHVGATGNGNRAKLAINLILGLSRGGGRGRGLCQGHRAGCGGLS